MTTFILIHGGQHGGWCWEHVAPLLNEEGYRVIAPDLPGAAADRTPLNQVTLTLYGDFVADLVRGQAEPVLLVGHSMGGLSISEAAERVPERLLGLVFVAATLGTGGRSMAEIGGTELAEATARGIIPSADGLSTTYDPAIAPSVFYNTTDPEEAQRAIIRLTPQPLEPVLAPLTVTAQRFGQVQRAYIECLEDHAIPISLQRHMQAALPCDPVFTMATDHSPFLCAPRELVQHLTRIEKIFAKKQSKLGARPG